VIKSLYVHIPFCESICDYCDFTKLQYFHNIADNYLDCLEKDLISTVKNKCLETIYVGGGTPTSLDDLQFERLLKMLSAYTNNVIEYTFEANPESLSFEKIKLLSKYGVNRISLGVESTNDKILSAINRHHSFNDVVNCFSLLRENGINNINVDLIIGLPNCTKQMFIKDLENVLSLNPNHISTYSLTVNPHTVFFNKGIKEPTGDYARDIYDYTHEILLKYGYTHYEVSNFAKPGKESKHNLTYWENNQYYAVGLGASGYEKNIRYKNTTNLNNYLKGLKNRENETVTKKDKMEYQIMLNLRTNKGLDLNVFKQLFKTDLYETKKKEIDSLISSNLCFIKDNFLIPTYEGMMVLDQIILALL